MSEAKGSYGTVSSSTAEAESARLKAQLQALWGHEAAMLKEVGFPRGARLLEVGCGTGAVLGQVRREFTPSLTVGIDLDAQHVGRARAIAPVARANGAALPFAAQSFELVLFRYVLRHVPQPGRLIAEAVRVLRPGGKVVALDSDDGGLILDPPPAGWPSLSHALEESVRRRGGDPHMGRSLLRLLKDAGLTGVRTCAQVITSTELAPPAFVQLLLAPEARPIDADLLDGDAAKAAWDAVRAWALSESSFLCALGIVASGTRP